MRTKYSKKNTINVVTLGCSKNIYDSEVLMGQLKANNKNVVHEKEGNIVVVNTCGFIDNAKEEYINTILEYYWKKEIPNVDQYFGTTDLPKLLKALKADYKHELVGERLTTTPKNYAYLKISEGCDRPCSFCAIPLMRGKHKSKSIEVLVNEATLLAKNGVKELILIAQDLTYYGLDLYKKRELSSLLKELVKVDGIEWIRLHYAFPNGFPLDVLEVIKQEEKVCNYIDIPLQHISTKILKSMRRGSKKENIIELINKMRLLNPEIAIRTTVIVGYPGESEEDFNELKEWIMETKFDRLGCFAYSHEENTHAYRLVDDVSPKIKQERINSVMGIQSQISLELNQKKINQVYKCVIDRKEGINYIGRTEFDSPDVDNEVLVDASKYYLKIGDFVNLKIIDCTEFDLYAIPNEKL